MADITLTITDIQILYSYAKKVFKKEISITDALKAATNEIPHRAPKSINNYLYNFADMMRGKKLSRTMPIDAHIYFLENIGNDFGKDYLFNALKSVQLHIIYIYKTEVIDKNKNPQSTRNTTLRNKYVHQ